VGLTDRDRAILQFEQGWWRRPGPKAAAITEHLGLSPTRYYELLNAAIDDPEATSVDPLLVRRLRHARHDRRRARFEGPGRRPVGRSGR
jgi:hypothetical protein